MVDAFPTHARGDVRRAQLMHVHEVKALSQADWVERSLLDMSIATYSSSRVCFFTSRCSRYSCAGPVFYSLFFLPDKMEQKYRDEGWRCIIVSSILFLMLLFMVAGRLLARMLQKAHLALDDYVLFLSAVGRAVNLSSLPCLTFSGCDSCALCHRRCW